MKLTIINGSNRLGNTSIRVARMAERLSKEMFIDTNFVNLMTFTNIFKGEYILTIDSSNPYQNHKLERIKNSAVLIFVVPFNKLTFNKALRNFILMTESFEIYRNKVLGVINACGNMDTCFSTSNFLTNVFDESIDDVLILNKVATINYEKIDIRKLEEYISYCASFSEVFQR